MALTFPNDGGPIGTSFVPSLFIFRTPLKKIIYTYSLASISD